MREAIELGHVEGTGEVMRSMSDVRCSNRFNETKAKILFLLVKTRRYLTSTQIADKCNMADNNSSRQLTKLAGQGYIWRRNADGIFKYRYLKPMGVRVCHDLWVRIKLREIDSCVSLNLKKPIPHSLAEQKKKYEQLYYNWLWSQNDETI